MKTKKELQEEVKSLKKYTETILQNFYNETCRLDWLIAEVDSELINRASIDKCIKQSKHLVKT